MSGLKMQMRLFTNQSTKQSQQNSQNQVTQQNIARSLQNQTTNIKLGFNATNRNFAALQLQGQKFCKSCNDKK